MDESEFDWLNVGDEGGDYSGDATYSDNWANEWGLYGDADSQEGGFYGDGTTGAGSGGTVVNGQWRTWEEIDAMAGVPAGTTYDSITKSANTSTGNKYLDWVNNKLGTNITVDDAKKGVVGAGAALGLLQYFQNKDKPPVGYQGGVDMSRMAVRQQVPQIQQAAAAPREYGAPVMGRRYFTDTQYTNPAGLAAAQAAANQQAQQLAEQQQPVQAAHGGLMHAAKGRYLQGASDGMADQLRTSIDGKQPAALSHGEFVVPADVVSHLGNGNSDAGAKKLYQMMDKVRQARTGTKKQGKQIDPNKFMPGGAVQKYAEGGGISSGTAAAINSGLTGTESNLSNWAGPYVTNMLSQGQALANAPYQAYTGQLTAGTAPLQQQAFNQAANLQVPAGMTSSYTPVTSDFSSQAASQYMNPYLQMSLAPQLAELQRQNQIANMGVNAKLTQAGGFGGGRQAVYNAENQRNMMSQMANTLGQGYNTAFNNAQQQFNADQARKMQEAQFGSTFGLQSGQAQQQAQLANLGALASMGGQQRAIEQEGLAAQKAQFEEERLNPYKMVQYQQSLLQGLPLAAQNYNVASNWMSDLAKGGVTAAQLLKYFGLDTSTPTTATPATTTTT